MEKQKRHLLKDFLTIAIAVAYFLVAVSHIFYLPCLTQIGVKTHSANNSIFKRKIENISVDGNNVTLLQRTYKFILEDKKSVTDILNSAKTFFSLLLLILVIWSLRPKYYALDLLNRITSYSYLSLRMLRI